MEAVRSFETSVNFETTRRHISVVSNSHSQNFENQKPHSLVMESTILFDVTSCSLVEVYWHFGGTYCLYFQGRRLRQSNSNDGCITLFRNVGKYLPDCTASHHSLKNLKCNKLIILAQNGESIKGIKCSGPKWHEFSRLT
jgi:hypothetical protein